MAYTESSYGAVTTNHPTLAAPAPNDNRAAKALTLGSTLSLAVVFMRTTLAQTDVSSCHADSPLL
ncbi:hypothetical protein HJFPF1_00926 [Paramyrothecium foliicola]|nr:hypothetical protein HJFPF1_00926 [Paramyrothecium foliicola]